MSYKIKENQKYWSIPMIIQNNDLVQFHSELRKAEQQYKIIRKRIGVNVVPVKQGLQNALMAVPYAYIEFECTESEYKSWKFNQSLLNNG